MGPRLESSRRRVDRLGRANPLFCRLTHHWESMADLIYPRAPTHPEFVEQFTMETYAQSPPGLELFFGKLASSVP